jgi:predicted Zn-dependent protease
MEESSFLFFLLFAGLIVGGIVASVIAWYARGYIAEKFVAMLWNEGNENYRFEPQYSIARARIAAGRFEDAVQEFRNAMALYPNDIMVHFYIADVLATHMKQPLDALTELDFGQRRTRDPEIIAKFVLRRAEIHLHDRRDPGNAAVELENYLKQYPRAKAAILLNEKLKQVREAQDRAG